MDTTQGYKLRNPIQSLAEYRVDLSPTEVKFFSDKALNAVHTLVLFADVKMLFVESGTTKKVVKKLPKSIASRFVGSEEWNSQRLSSAFGLNVRVSYFLRLMTGHVMKKKKIYHYTCV